MSFPHGRILWQKTVFCHPGQLTQNSKNMLELLKTASNNNQALKLWVITKLWSFLPALASLVCISIWTYIVPADCADCISLSLWLTYIIQLILQTFADWGIDMLKMDGCHVDVELLDAGYRAMSLCLNLTQRPIVFSCSWPDYVRAAGMSPDYKRVAEYCNLWRNYDDIDVR